MQQQSVGVGQSIEARYQEALDAAAHGDPALALDLAVAAAADARRMLGAGEGDDPLYYLWCALGDMVRSLAQETTGVYLVQLPSAANDV
jgi:hypothetical protein